jgi:hypothetical protein
MFSRVFPPLDAGVSTWQPVARLDSSKGIMCPASSFSLGVQPTVGRLLGAADDVCGCSGAAVVSHSFWSDEYGRNPQIVGKTITLNGLTFPIVGISQPGFPGLDVGTSIAVYLPIGAKARLHIHPANILNLTSLPKASGIYRWLNIIGRFKPGVTSAAATARLHSLAPVILSSTVPHHWPMNLQSQYVRRTFGTRSVVTVNRTCGEHTARH